jgi:ribosomal RNA-processing protein 8
MGKNKNNKGKNSGQGGADKSGRPSWMVKKAPVSAERSSVAAARAPSSAAVTAPQSKLSAMQQKFKQKLEGARFRIINERLYTCRGNEALKEFKQDPSLFDVYHEGFREMASAWPQNPLDLVVEMIQSKYPKEVVADMGCGDAALSRRLSNKVHNFDLVSRDPSVTACDMAHVPLKSKSVGVVVFCLALMGENIEDFIKEAHRILHDRGVLWIAEVKSRFDGPDIDLNKFFAFLSAAGFDKIGKDTGNNKMFFTVTCKKSADREPKEELTFKAKPCIYKRR